MSVYNSLVACLNFFLMGIIIGVGTWSNVDIILLSLNALSGFINFTVGAMDT